jgi:hypothetical protein
VLTLFLDPLEATIRRVERMTATVARSYGYSGFSALMLKYFDNVRI